MEATQTRIATSTEGSRTMPTTGVVILAGMLLKKSKARRWQQTSQALDLLVTVHLGILVPTPGQGHD